VLPNTSSKEITDNFPDLLAEQQHVLITSAATGAQQAAKLGETGVESNTGWL